jgi:uncharacterized protein YxjI
MSYHNPFDDPFSSPDRDTTLVNDDNTFTYDFEKNTNYVTHARRSLKLSMNDNELSKDECPSPRQSRKFSLKSKSPARENTHYEVRTFSNGIITFSDEDNNVQYKILVERSENRIYINDRNKEEFAVISKAMLGLHPTYVITRNGLRLGKATQRFKPAKKKKFNYKVAEGSNVFKISGKELSDFKMKKNDTHETVASIEVIGGGNYSLDINTKEKDLVHVIALIVICIAG